MRKPAGSEVGADAGLSEQPNASHADAFVDGMQAARAGHDRCPPDHFTPGTHAQWFAGYDMEAAHA